MKGLNFHFTIDTATHQFFDEARACQKSHLLGKYGDKNVREAKQYFLSDGCTELRCSFEKLGEYSVNIAQLRFSKISMQQLQYLGKTIFNTLPQQGAIEVQKDQPGKVHEWHAHPTDETLVILRGRIKFCHRNGEKVCLPGNVIHLPKGTLHSSTALDEGAVYLIATRELNV